MNTPNPVVALTTKKRKLIEEKRLLKEEYDRRIAKLDGEIKNIDGALDTINKAIAPYKCPQCGGDGNIRKPDAAGQMEDCPCPVCKGTGINPNVKL